MVPFLISRATTLPLYHGSTSSGHIKSVKKDMRCGVDASHTYLSVAAHLKIVKELSVLSKGIPIKELMKLKCITTTRDMIGIE